MPPCAATSASNRSFTGRGNVSAPEKHARRQDKSLSSSDGSFVSASYSVGTPTSRFGRALLSSFATILAENCGTRIEVAPTRNAAFTHTPRPKPWKIGRIARIESLGPIPTQAAACMPCAMTLRLDSTTPFGTPVVPPENRITAGSSVPVEARAAGGCEADVKSFHQRTRGSSGTGAILRPLVSQKPMRLAGERWSPMRASTMCRNGSRGFTRANTPANASRVSATCAPLSFRYCSISRSVDSGWISAATTPSLLAA